MEDSIFVKCTCHCSVAEFKYVKEEDALEISIWASHPGKILSHEERVRWCNHIMETGDPGQIIHRK